MALFECGRTTIMDKFVRMVSTKMPHKWFAKSWDSPIPFHFVAWDWNQCQSNCVLQCRTSFVMEQKSSYVTVGMNISIQTVALLSMPPYSVLTRIQQQAHVCFIELLFKSRCFKFLKRNTNLLYENDEGGFRYDCSCCTTIFNFSIAIVQ